VPVSCAVLWAISFISSHVVGGSEKPASSSRSLR
jgi:hypothetical protein